MIWCNKQLKKQEKEQEIEKKYYIDGVWCEKTKERFIKDARKYETDYMRTYHPDLKIYKQ